MKFRGDNKFIIIENIKFDLRGTGNKGSISIRDDHWSDPGETLITSNNIGFFNCEFDGSNWNGAEAVITCRNQITAQAVDNKFQSITIAFCEFRNTTGEDAINIIGRGHHIHHNKFFNINEEAIDYSGGSYSTIEYNYVSGTSANGFKIHPQNGYLTNCTIRGNLIMGPGDGSGSEFGIALWNLEDCTINNNTIFGDQGNQGLGLYYSPKQYSDFPQDFSGNAFINNIIHAPSITNTWEENEPYTYFTDNNDFDNNSYYDPRLNTSVAFYHKQGAGSVLDPNIVTFTITSTNFSTTWANQTNVSNDFYHDVQFVDGDWSTSIDFPDNVDYSLASTSPARNTGLDITGYNKDIIGTTVPYPFAKIANNNINIKGSIENYVLSGNYPNPFNPSTNIYYSLPYNSIVTIQIFDITGKLVKSFKQSNESAGHHSIVWNGKNSNNLDVASGVYMIRFFALSLENNEVFTKSGKMLLTK
jgi:hypothetical protein